MAEQIHLEIVTPKGSIINEKVDIVTAPGYAGEFGVLANHAAMLSTIKIGILSYKVGARLEYVMVSGGFCEVSGKKITFLVEAAEKGENIDVDRAMRAKERAEKRLAQIEQRKTEIDRARADAALQRSIARIKASKTKSS